MNDTVILPVSGVGYDADFHAWTQDQGRKLRAGCFSELVLANTALSVIKIDCAASS